MLTICGDIVLDSKLSEKNERILWHFFLACKMYSLEVAKSEMKAKRLDSMRENTVLYSTIFQGVNTVLYFIKYSQFMHAAHALDFLQTYLFSSLKSIQGET